MRRTAFIKNSLLLAIENNNIKMIKLIINLHIKVILF